MNKVIISGRLTKDPEMKMTANGMAVTNFTIAVKRKFKRENEPDVDFLNVVVWAKPAEFVAKYFTKGSGIEVAGRIQTRNYDNKEGQKVYVTEIVAEDVEFGAGASKKDDDNSSGTTKQSIKQNLQVIEEDEELPF